MREYNHRREWADKWREWAPKLAGESFKLRNGNNVMSAVKAARLFMCLYDHVRDTPDRV